MFVLAWPTRCSMSSIGTPELDSSETKRCRKSLGVHDQPDLKLTGHPHQQPGPTRRSHAGTIRTVPAWAMIIAVSGDVSHTKCGERELDRHQPH